MVTAHLREAAVRLKDPGPSVHDILPGYAFNARVVRTHERDLQMSRIAFAVTPYSTASMPAVLCVLVFPSLKMWTAWPGVNFVTPSRSRSGSAAA